MLSTSARIRVRTSSFLRAAARHKSEAKLRSIRGAARTSYRPDTLSRLHTNIKLHDLRSMSRSLRPASRAPQAQCRQSMLRRRRPPTCGRRCRAPRSWPPSAKRRSKKLSPSSTTSVATPVWAMVLRAPHRPFCDGVRGEGGAHAHTAHAHFLELQHGTPGPAAQDTLLPVARSNRRSSLRRSLVAPAKLKKRHCYCTVAYECADYLGVQTTRPALAAASAGDRLDSKARPARRRAPACRAPLRAAPSASECALRAAPRPPGCGWLRLRRPRTSEKLASPDTLARRTADFLFRRHG